MQTTTTSGIRVRHPDGTEVRTATAGRRRGYAQLDPIREALLSGLTSQMLLPVDEIVIAPAAGPVGRRSTPDAAEGITLAVPTGSGDKIVLLIERGGAYAWQVAESTERDRPLRAPPGTAVFRIGPVEGAQPEQRRGLIGEMAGAVLEPVRAVVLKFAARQLVGSGLARLERNVKTGLIDMGEPDPRGWQRLVPGSLNLPTDGSPSRVLLMVHGTFSSTVGSFGGLAATAWGRSFLERARSCYDAVLGYDHATLSLTPEINAQGLLDALRGLNATGMSHIDTIAFSRGGLVYRALAERLTRQLNWPGDFNLDFGPTVFVGCTNGGTELANPENWRRYLDIYTNLAAAAGRGISLLDGGIGGTILSESVKTLGGLVQAVVSTAIEDDMLPGVAAMRPQSRLVTELNSAPTAVGGPYYAMGASFDPGLAAAIEAPISGLSVRIARVMASDAAQSLMGQANDLVVDTEAMTAFGNQANRLKGKHTWEHTSAVYHTNYFLQQDVVEQAADWLNFGTIPDTHPTPSLPIGPRGIRRLSPVPARTKPRQQDVVDQATHRPNLRTMPDPPPTPSLPRVSRRGRRVSTAPERTQPRQKDVECYFVAEMAECSPLERPARLTVTVSREDIKIVEGLTRQTANATVQPDSPITLSLEARRNCTIVGIQRVEIEPPDDNKPEPYDFKVQGTEAGPAELWVEAHQGARRLIRMVLQPEFVSTVGILRTGAVARSYKPDPPMVELRIYEESDGDDRPFRLRFVLESRDLGVALDRQTKQFQISQKAYVDTLYGKLEGRWDSDGAAFDDFMKSLADFGAEIYCELIPLEIRQALWEYRDRIGAIEVISHEPYIPWEVAYLVEPDKPLRDGDPFLAELGLIRWVSNAGFAPVRLRVREGQARFVVPDYPDLGWKLPGAQDEIELLKGVFNATAVPASTRELRTLLGEAGSFDLLHFACHGIADPARIWEAGLAMEGRMEGGAYVQDKLELSTVRQRANLRHADGGRPIVFLNACQAARTGRTLSGTGGMADAFIRTGAGLFVGTLWSIGDDTARGFARAFYEGMKSGATLTQATRAARHAAREANEPTWLAYAVYGHPYAYLEA
jgi:hypothetical protein